MGLMVGEAGEPPPLGGQGGSAAEARRPRSGARCQAAPAAGKAAWRWQGCAALIAGQPHGRAGKVIGIEKHPELAAQVGGAGWRQAGTCLELRHTRGLGASWLVTGVMCRLLESLPAVAPCLVEEGSDLRPPTTTTTSCMAATLSPDSLCALSL